MVCIAPFWRYAADAKVFAASQHAGNKLGVDGIFRDSEARGDFGVGEIVIPAEQEDFAAAFREAGNGRGKNLEFLIMACGFGCIRSVIYNGQPIELSYAFHGNSPVVANEIERRVARDDEKIGPRQIGFPRGTRPQQPRVGLLNQIVDVT
jgi:hypothetical protein